MSCDPDEMDCPYCGHLGLEWDSGDLYCKSCGSTILLDLEDE